jgi:NAD dependent epimerase/dehydratase family enzyme
MVNGTYDRPPDPRDHLAGPVNLAAPEPLPQRDFRRAPRAAARAPLGLPATKWMVELGAFFLRSDTELLLQSRRVVPGHPVEAGFAFDFPAWPATARDLVERMNRSP